MHFFLDRSDPVTLLERLESRIKIGLDTFPGGWVSGSRAGRGKHETCFEAFCMPVHTKTHALMGKSKIGAEGI